MKLGATRVTTAAEVAIARGAWAEWAARSLSYRIETMRRFGVKGFFGDPTRPELLEAAGLAEASVLVVAVDSPESALRIVAHARSVRPDIHIVARALAEFGISCDYVQDVVNDLKHHAIRGAVICQGFNNCPIVTSNKCANTGRCGKQRSGFAFDAHKIRRH
mgnify:CR=1 FL=1